VNRDLFPVLSFSRPQSPSASPVKSPALLRIPATLPSRAPALSATNTDTEVGRRTVSNETGSYVVPLLPPGRYRISVQADGFKPIDRQGIVLAVDQVSRIDFTLEVGQITESVQVTAAAAPVDQETSSLGQVIENKRIVELPLNAAT